MSLDKELLKASMIRDKGFLKTIFEGNSLTNVKILTAADDSQLNTVIKILHFIANGEIKVKKAFSENKRLIKILRKNFETKAATLRLLKTTRIEKLKLLKQFNSNFTFLFYHIFNL